MKRRCPRCGSEKRAERDRKSEKRHYTSFGKRGSNWWYTVTYVCDECGLLYVQEEM
jgi:predicted RNA-binding Zn-ribbon protein involved in translation (DUF1610 family)